MKDIDNINNSRTLLYKKLYYEYHYAFKNYEEFLTMILDKINKLDDNITLDDLDKKLNKYIQNYIKNTFYNKELEVIEDINPYDDLKNNGVLSKEDEIFLLKKAQNGDKFAKEIFINYNIGLVKKEANRLLTKEVYYEDLVQEGLLGLIKAIEKFDFTKGTTFSTYAIYWIDHTIKTYIQKKGRLIQLPFSKYQELVKYKIELNKLVSKIGYVPNNEEIAEYLGLTLDEIVEYNKLQSHPVAINQKVKEDSETELGDLIPDEDVDVEDDIDKKALRTTLKEIINNFNYPDRKKEILMLRFGLIDGKEHSLRDLGKKYHLTAERIRQIEAGCIKRLRYNARVAELRYYLDNPEQGLSYIRKFNDWQRENPASHVVYHVDEKIKNKKANTSKKKRRTKTIYNYFNNRELHYLEEEFNLAILMLGKSDRRVVYLRYGDDFNNPEFNENWNRKLENRFYGVIVDRIIIYAKAIHEINNGEELSEFKLKLFNMFNSKEEYKKVIDIISLPVIANNLIKLNDEELKYFVMTFIDNMTGNDISIAKISKELCINELKCYRYQEKYLLLLKKIKLEICIKFRELDVERLEEEKLIKYRRLKKNNSKNE